MLDGHENVFEIWEANIFLLQNLNYNNLLSCLLIDS